jgi:mRNA interferase RelE/StbE
LVWQIDFTPRAEKELARLGAQDARRIVRFLKERVASNPKALGGPLKGQLRVSWRWRVGDYRVIAKLEDERLLVLVVRVAHRSKVYTSPL